MSATRSGTASTVCSIRSAMFQATPHQTPSPPATATGRRPFGGAREHLLDYRADGGHLEARVPVPAQRRPGDRRVPRRPPRPARARRPHRGGPRARPAVRVRPRDRRGDRRDGRRRPSRGRDASAWVAEPLRTIRSTVRSRGRWSSSTAPTPRCCTRSTAGSAEAAAPGTRVRIRWADETEGQITDIACFERADERSPDSRRPGRGEGA